MKEIEFNPDIFSTTGIANFSVPGLYSIILDKKGPYKRRLFLYTNNDNMPHVPLHMHKYIDEMEYLFGNVTDLCYKESEEGNSYSEYEYARLNENKKFGKTGKSKKFILDKAFENETHKIYAHHYHTVNVKGFSAWIIHELCMNELYNDDRKCYSNETFTDEPLDTKPMSREDYIFIFMTLNLHGIILHPSNIISKENKELSSIYNYTQRILDKSKMYN